MKKLLLTIALIAAAVISYAQCAAPTVSGGAYKHNKYQIIVSNPDKHYIDVEWVHNGNSTVYKCTGVWNDKNKESIVTISRMVNPGSSYYGIQDGDILRVYMHCTNPVTYTACFSDTNVSAPSQDLTVVFH